MFEDGPLRKPLLSSALFNVSSSSPSACADWVRAWVSPQRWGQSYNLHLSADEISNSCRGNSKAEENVF